MSTISPLPTPPSRSDDSDTFVTLADAFIAALPQFVTETNAVATQILASTSAQDYNGTSVTSLTVGTGSKSLTMTTNKALQVGQFVVVSNTATPANYMYGQVTAYNGTTGALTVNVTATGGSGTFTAWTVALSPIAALLSFLSLAGGTLTGLLATVASASGGAGFRVPHGAAPSSPVDGDLWSTSTGLFAQINGVTRTAVFAALAQTLTNKRITPRAPVDVGTSGVLTPTADAADLYVMTGLTGGITIGAPSGTPTDGQKLILRVKDNGTSRAISWNSVYRAFGTIALPLATTAGKTHYFGCEWNAADSRWDVLGQVVEL